jgi:hypothetical protein
VEFQGWSIETGPIFEPVAEVWDRIDADLSKNDIATAAGRLRRHLEFSCRELADELAAPIPYRGDARYELGELVDAVISRQDKLISRAADAANSWNDEPGREAVRQLRLARKSALELYGDEQWFINTAVHYNDWATMSKEDFQPVVAAAKVLIEQFRCQKCDSWIYPSPKDRPESLRCSCPAVNFNLKRRTGS